MPFDPHLAAIRFGTGLSPRLPLPRGVDAMLALLTGEDQALRDWPHPGFAEMRPSVADFRDMSRALRAARGTADQVATEAAEQRLRQAARAARLDAFGAALCRAVASPDGLRERLVMFWANHFTVRARGGFTNHLVGAFVQSAIRPHVAGRFGDMLRAVITHPMMIDYLDQTQSMGPNSPAAQRRDRGLNENLARELLELHTVGVEGPYDQTDVRQLAELLTGLGWDPDTGQTVFRADQAEPGSETVLSVTYPAEARIETIKAVLDRLAVHPGTARHIGRKLAVHFVSDTPDPALVDLLATRFADTGGDLLAVTEALLTAPAAWAPEPAKVKPPLGFVVSALRALDVPVDRIRLDDLRESRRRFLNPLLGMGQPWEEPPGPDGWPEAAADWITPQFMAARIEWALNVPERLLTALPDPRDFVAIALGPQPPAEVVLAAGAAEDRALGIGVTLASAAFHRR